VVVAAYGRLDVYWPDGPIESFLLDKPEVALGRSSGNDIMLDTTTISRYHIRISHKDDQVSVTDLDSVNGTYVDGTRLPAQESRILKGGEEIQIGDLRAIFQPAISRRSNRIPKQVQLLRCRLPSNWPTNCWL
jgi:pSer/pThr/pTyr-binding forkhead associated (FHA) protein